MIDVSELMTDPDFAREITVQRPTLTVANEGQASYTYETTKMLGIVQPASMREVEMLPEGDRLKDVISVWSACLLKATNADDAEADIIVVGTHHYRVIKSESWPENGYYRVFAEGFVP